MKKEDFNKTKIKRPVEVDKTISEYKDYALVFDNVTFSYTPENVTLNNVSFKIRKGEYVALIGHNGSGKSTLAKLIVGSILQQSGKIFIHGIEFTDENTFDLRDYVGIVFQNPDNQFIGQSVRDDIAFSLENMCVDPKKMDEIILNIAKKVNMDKFLDNEPTSLSGGQKQRVAIAGTLVRNPHILILDESTSMLDPKGKRDIFDLIHKMKDDNPELTVISITHEIDEAFRSDRVLVLNDGKLVMEGKPQEIFSKSEELEKIGLTIPFYSKLTKELKDLGIDIDGVNSLDGLVKKLCQ